MKKDIITGLDLGTTKVCAAIAEKDFEKSGYIPLVVFPTGWVRESDNPDQVVLYYGCADTDIAAVTMSISEIIASIRNA